MIKQELIYVVRAEEIQAGIPPEYAWFRQKDEDHARDVYGWHAVEANRAWGVDPDDRRHIIVTLFAVMLPAKAGDPDIGSYVLRHIDDNPTPWPVLKHFNPALVSHKREIY